MIQKALGQTAISVSAIGQGLSIGSYKTRVGRYEDQVDNIRLGISLGMTLLDTAPVYGDGHSERVVGQAVADVRQEVCLATKLRPGKTRPEEVEASAAESLERTGCDVIDLLQIHWPNPDVPLADTIGAMGSLVERGVVEHIGVSNFSLAELEEAREALPTGDIQSLQVEYNLFDRGVEDDLLPYCQEAGITVMAYSPLHRGRIANGPDHLAVLETIAEAHGATPAQVALRWLVSHEGVVAIPNSTNPTRLKENARSADIALTDGEIERISSACAPKSVEMDTDRIRPAREDEEKVYRTVDQARENALGMSPSPTQLSEQIKGGEMLKPFRVTPSQEPGYYDLVEGRLRYWAWVIAFDGKRPIPVLLDESSLPEEVV